MGRKFGLRASLVRNLEIRVDEVGRAALLRQRALFLHVRPAHLYQGSGFRVQGLGFGVWGLVSIPPGWFGVYGSGENFALGFRVSDGGYRFRLQGQWARIEG